MLNFSFLQRLLWPLACLYDLVMSLRNGAFDRGWLPVRTFPCKTIAIGNLAVGGTGKTPHAEYLLSMLSPQRPTALLSRGYGRKSRGFVLASPHSTAAELGDEPLQMWRKFPNVSVAVDENRCEGIDRLLSLPVPPEVVVLDDAFQHRYVKAGLYILLTDYSRLYADDFVLPAGRLRESRRGAKRAQVVVVTKCPVNLDARQRQTVARKLNLNPRQQLFFTTFRYGAPYALCPNEAAETAGKEMLVVTGIARPQPLYEHLKKQGYRITPLRFPDHHAFTPDDVALMNRTFSKLPEGSSAITTEKDAARLRLLSNQLTPALRRGLRVQPVVVHFLEESGKSRKAYQQVQDRDSCHREEDKFKLTIYNYVTSH